GSGGEIRAVVAPHIDLRVGKDVYGKTYSRLSGISGRNFVILGVGHQMEKGIFSVSPKDFLTPLGLVTNHREYSRRLMAFEEPLVTTELYHRSEHSVEFQTLFLRYLFPESQVRIVPILCGPVLTYLKTPSREAYLGLCKPFIQEMKGILGEDPHTVLIAGIDLSHIGPKFGDPYPAEVLENSTKAHDQEILKAMVEVDPELLWEAYRKTGGRYKVCGFSALALLLELLDGVKGELIAYELWHEPPTQSAVSFAGMIYR
ncbi:MAG: AmmeMemoRadiSam system protein B, partial [Desulfatiglandales bacterium]